MLRFVLPIVILLFYSCNNNRQKLTQKTDSKDTSLKIISTGLPSIEAITQLNTLSKKYGFKYYPVGCVVTKQLMDSIQRENNLTYKILEDRFGRGWRNNFNSQYAKINQLRLQADSIITARFPQKNKNFYYLITPIENRNYYQVKVYSTDSLNGKTELMVHYKMTISFGQNSSAPILKTFEKL